MIRLTLTIIVISVVGFFTEGLAQKKKTTEQPPEPVQKTEEQIPMKADNQNLMDEHYFKKYTMAVRWNDGEMAKDALYDLIVNNPQNDSLIFNLAYYYYDNQEFAPAMLVTQELIARQPKNPGYLELSGASFEAIGILDRALQNYETLYLLTNSTPSLYKIAFLQYDLKRYSESLTNVNILLTKPDLADYPIGFNDAQGNPKDYPMQVAVMNLKGLLLEGNGDKEGAKQVYNEILQLSPDFQPAKANLAKLK